MKRDLPYSEAPNVMTPDEARYESYSDSRDIGISHETLCGFWGEVVCERYQERYRRECQARNVESRCADYYEAYCEERDQ